MAQKRGVTLIEVIVTVIVMGILATLGMMNYTPIREGAFDREAQVNLRLILAAQRIYRMEVGRYFPYAYGTNSNIGDFNTYLKLLLPASANRNWDYSATSSAGAYCGQATRNVAGGRDWRMGIAGGVPDSDPAVGACP